MIKRIFISLLIFVLFYTPPIFGYRSLRLVIPVSIAYLILDSRCFFRYIFKTKLIIQYGIWVGIVLYICLVGFITGNGAEYIAPQIYWLLSVIPTATVISCVIQREGMGIKGLIDCSLAAGMAQSFLAIAAFLSPAIKQALFTSLVQGHIIEEEKYIGEYYRRMYGLSGGLTFGTPVLQAFLAMIALYMALNYKSKYFLLIPFLFFSAIINARSSVVVVLICAGIILVQKNRNMARKIGRILFFVLIVIIAFVAVAPIIESVAPNTFIWIGKGFHELALMSQGDVHQGYFSYLFNKNKWIFPDGLGIIFGYGIRVMGNNKYGSETDVGIVNDMWFGGIIYILIAYGLFFSYCKKIRRIDFYDKNNKNRIDKIGGYLFWAFLLNAIVLDFKSFIIDIHSLSMFFIILLVYIDLFACRDVKGSSWDNNCSFVKPIRVVMRG